LYCDIVTYFIESNVVQVKKEAQFYCYSKCLGPRPS